MEVAAGRTFPPGSASKAPPSVSSASSFSDRRELFPLPLPCISTVAPSPDLSRSVRRRLQRASHVDRSLAESVCALNVLSGRSSAPVSKPSQAQSDVLDNISRVVRNFEAHHDPQLDPAGALRALCKSGTGYCNTSAPAPYSEDLVSWPPSGAQPVPLVELVSGEALQFLRQGATSLLRSSDQQSAVSSSVAVSRPFSEPSLVHHSHRYSRFVRHLVNCGMAKFVLASKASVGVFFVRKKNGKIG